MYFIMSCFNLDFSFFKTKQGGYEYLASIKHIAEHSELLGNSCDTNKTTVGLKHFKIQRF